MTSNTLRQPGMRERVQQLGYLLKNTLSLVGRDPGILRPGVRMCLYGVAMTSLFFIGVITLWGGAGRVALPALLLSLAMFVYKYFYYTRQELRQSWLVSEALQGQQRTAAEAGARVKGMQGSARGIALIDILLGGMLSWALRSGPGNVLISLLLKGLGEAWDLTNHYLLPSVVIDRHGIRDSISRIPRLKESVPETLVGVFGIDIAARAVGTIMFPVYALLVILGVAVGIWLGDPQSAFYLGDPLMGAELAGGGMLPDSLPITAWPVLIALWMAKLLSVVLERLAASVKVIYFSIFYMRITHPEAIVEAIRDELEAYLRMEVQNPDSAMSPGSQQA